MQVKHLVLQLTKRERGKKQVNIAQMTEIVGKLSDMIYREAISADAPSVMRALLRLGARRAEARKYSRP